MKQSKRITHQSKSIENPNVLDIKSVTIAHPKTSHKLCKTIRQGKKFSQVVDAAKDKHVDLLLIGKGEKNHYVLIKRFNTFMYYHTLNL